MLTLRPYQEAAKTAVWKHLSTRDDNPCVVLPTAAGKTPLLASICKDAVERWGGRVLNLAHVKELLEQSADKLRLVCPELEFGIYSAGMRRRDTDHAVIVAGIQSVYQRACELDAFDVAIVDEAHMIPVEGEGRYRQFLADAKTVNPNLRVVGLTATPFRLKTGEICTPDGIFNHICYEVGVRELIRDGYLSPLVTKTGQTKVDMTDLHSRGGEFVAGEVERLMDRDQLVEAACAEIAALTGDRRATLVFASGIAHGRHIVEVLRRNHGLTCGFVCGKTSPRERAETLRQFQAGGLQYLCNVNVLTTGFDAPHIDCVALVRPTMSPGLYYQMVGRGFRLHSDKQNCLVLDFGGNVLRHGPVDAIEVTTIDRKGGKGAAKQCPKCRSLIAAGFATCPDCGHKFPDRQPRDHDAEPSQASILSGEYGDVEYDVRDVTYSVHTKRDAKPGAPNTMRVEYRLGLNHWQREFICFEHTGYAREKAIAWWRLRSADPVPATAQQAVDIAKGCGVAAAMAITVRTVAGERYDRIVAYRLDPKPEPANVPGPMGLSLEEIPF